MTEVKKTFIVSGKRLSSVGLHSWIASAVISPGLRII